VSTPTLHFVARRAALAVPVLFGVSVMVFSIMHLLPGDPAQIMLAGAGNVSAQQIADLHHRLGLDQPLYVQYLTWIGAALHGNLGRSIQDRTPVWDEIAQNAPATFELAAAALFVALALGVAMGTIAAAYRHTWIDAVASTIGVIGTSVPNFWAAIVLILVFALLLGWLPSTGGGDLPHLVLPALALGLDYAAVNTRLVRSGMVDVLQQDYVRTARAKGVGRAGVVYKHALKNALIPMVTIAGLQFGNLLAGAVVIETVFARQGLGRMLLAGILAKDYPMVQGVVLFIALVYVLVNLGVDLAYGMLDPRIRLQ
jgi:peptide/nickel transport system permease protein